MDNPESSTYENVGSEDDSVQPEADCPHRLCYVALDGLRTRNFVQVIVRQMDAICCCVT
jgi:hypothetical protein